MTSAQDSVEKEFHILKIEDSLGARMVCLNAAAYSIGRDSDSNAIVIADPSVSRNHALLFRTPLPEKKYVYRLVDGDSAGNPSKNGLFINNQAYTEKLLKTGDKIVLGELTQLTYLLATMAQEEFERYFGVDDLTYHSLKEEALDPTFTVVNLNQAKEDQENLG